MRKFYFKLFLFVVFALSISFLTTARAFAINNPFSGLQDPTTNNEFTTVEEYGGLVVNIVFGISIAISSIGIILAGIKYMSAKSDIKAIIAAKSALTHSIVGFLLSVGVFGLLKIILSIL